MVLHRLAVRLAHIREGDRVAIEPGIPCRECFLCMDGRYNLCEDVQFAGVYPFDGTLQRYMVHPSKWLHKLSLHRFGIEETMTNTSQNKANFFGI